MSKPNSELYTELCSAKTLQSDPKGFFMAFASHVTDSIDSDWLKDKFKNANDNQKIHLIFDDKTISEKITTVLPNFQEFYKKKNATLSQEKRIQAQKLMEIETDLEKVLMILSQAVTRAPMKGEDLLVDGGLSLAFALWARSEILLQLNEPSLALSDIQLSLKEGLPGKQTADIYWRMAKCYIQMNEEKKAKVAIGLAVKLLGDDQDKIEMLQADIKNTKQLIKESEKCIPVLKDGPNKNLKGASSLITISESKKMGRYAVATGNISAGDTLLIEEPYAACLIPQYFGSHCHHCFAVLKSSIGCTKCSGVAFCSLKCRDDALSTYHKYECKILDVLIGSGMSILCHLALRMITQFNFKNVMEIYDNRMQLPIYKLCTLSEKREWKDFLHRILMAVLLTRFLQIADFFPKRDDSEVAFTENEFKITELLLMHMQFLQFNAHEISEIRHSSENRFSDTKEVHIAVAVYQTASLFNHECYPCVTRYFSGRNIIMTASKPIIKGEMISENYGPIFTRLPQRDRQRALASRYWFNCDCVACVQNWPLLSELDENPIKLKCPHSPCKGFFILPDIDFKCSVCNKDVNLDDPLITLTCCENLYEKGMDAMENQNPQEAIDIFCRALNDFHRIAYLPHKETHCAQEALRKCLCDFGNTWQTLPDK